MVRGNWQKRVETAARRKSAKERKQQLSEQKRHFKTSFQDVLSMLERHEDAFQRRITKADPTQYQMHIWTDCLPSTSPPFLDLVVEDDGGKAKRGGRSTAAANDTSHSKPTGGGKKKSSTHPRSKDAIKEAEALAAASEETRPLQLCKSQFFSGKCSDPQKGGKKGGCRCFHFTEKVPTLCSTLSSVRQQKVNSSQPHPNHRVLSDSEAACFVEEDFAENRGMEMVYYVSIPLQGELLSATSISQETSATNTTSDEEVSSTTISDRIASTLADNSCGTASIVYLVVSTPTNTVLLYDRNREGLVFSDSQFTACVLGLKAENPDDDTAAATSIIVQHLTAPVLEHVLMFLPDSAVAIAKRVCSTWNEIGASPNLWRCLLQRRAWPFPPNIAAPTTDVTGEQIERQAPTAVGASEINIATTQELRDQFIKHYSVTRDIRGIQLALHGLLTKKATEEREMTYQAFYARRGAPQAPNKCVAVDVWGPNRVLAAYSNDCTLRLFRAVAREGSASKGDMTEKFCRELICQSIDPYKHTKRKTCFMLDMGLDEDVVGTLCSVTDESNDFKTPHILVVISRDDLLQGDSSTHEGSGLPEGALRVFNVEEAVLNYILSLDQVDQRLLRLHDFLALGGSMEDVEVIVSQSLAACGYGRFMVEVAVSIPHDDDNNDGVDGSMLLLDRKLFLFSSSLGAIVWMNESSPSTDRMRPAEEDMTLISFRRPWPGGGTRTACTVAVASHAYAPALVTCEIDPSGNIEGIQELPRDRRLLEEGWSARADRTRPIAITSTDIVVGDTLTRVLEGNGERVLKTHITFYPRFANDDSGGINHYRLAFEDNCALDRMACFRDEYLVMLCRFYSETGYIVEDGGGGHWGGNNDNRVAKVYAIALHVPTRKEIERVILYDDFGNNKLTLSTSGSLDMDTVVAGAWLKGLIMTGSDVRSQSESASDNNVIVLDESSAPAKQSKKKGKKRLSKGSNKKDGFARGQSLRG